MAKKQKKKYFDCEVECINCGKVEAVRKLMKPDPIIGNLAQTFKVLGDATRTKMIFALSQEELCVCDIASLLKMSQSAISHQLRVLRNMQIVRCRKDGKVAYYSLDDNHIKNLFDEGLRHVMED